MPRRRLSKATQFAVIDALAQFASVADVQRTLREDFALEVPLKTIAYYNAAVAGNDLAQHLRDRFAEQRRDALLDLEGIGIANKAVRLRRLERIYHQAGRNHVLALAALEQAAKEMGDAYTNTRKLQPLGGDGQPTSGVLMVPVVSPDDWFASAARSQAELTETAAAAAAEAVASVPSHPVRGAR